MGRRSSSVPIKGDRIKEVLSIKGDSVTELSKRIRYARSGVSTAINADIMDVAMLDAIARDLDCSIDYLKGVEEPRSPKYGWLLTADDILDSQGRIIPHYNEILKSRLAVLQEYLILLGKRGIEDLDAGIVHNWTSEKVTEVCDASFEFRLAQCILKFLQDEHFLPTLPSKEVNIKEGD